MTLQTPGPIRTPEDELREAAIKHLKAKRDFKGHLLAYVSTNVLLVAIWIAVGGGFFWPLFPIFGWGIGIAMHAWDVYAPDTTPAQVDAEMERLSRTRH